MKKGRAPWIGLSKRKMEPHSYYYVRPLKDLKRAPVFRLSTPKRAKPTHRVKAVLT